MRRAEGFPEIFIHCTEEWELQKENRRQPESSLGSSIRFLVWVSFLEPGFPALTWVHADSKLWPVPFHRSVLPKLCFKTCLYHCHYSWLLFFFQQLLLALAVLPSWLMLAFFVSHDSALTNHDSWYLTPAWSNEWFCLPFGFPGRGTCRLSGEPDDTLGPDCDSQVCSGPSAAWGALLWIFS